MQKNYFPGICVYLSRLGSGQALSNENGTPVEVFFDDFSVHLMGTDIVQKDDDYPFGGSFNAYTDLSTPQQDYLYNGVRLNKTTQLYETAFRTYDPYLGRFNHIDPLTAMVPGLSPYHFGFNNPVRYSDPMGLMGDDAGMWGTGNTYASTHSQNPFDLMPKFTRTSPGSGNHWSDQYRDPYHNWMLMDTDGFRDFYGLDNGFGGTNLERAMELTRSFAGIGSSQGASFFYGVNGMGDGNGNIIPGTEVYILYQHLTNSRPSGGSNNAINTTLNLFGGVLSAPAGTMSLRGWGHDMLLKEGQWLGNNGRIYSTKFYGSNKWLSGTQKAFRAAGSAAKFAGNALGGLGAMVSVGSAYNAWLNDRDNTSTLVDLTITGGLFIGGLAAGISGAPVFATLGIIYGGYRLTGGSNGDALIDQYFGYR